MGRDRIAPGFDRKQLGLNPFSETLVIMAVNITEDKHLYEAKDLSDNMVVTVSERRQFCFTLEKQTYAKVFRSPEMRKKIVGLRGNSNKLFNWIVRGIQFINDVVVKNNGGVSEIYAAVGDGYYSEARSNTFMGSTNYGLYKSTNGGSTWTRLSLPVTETGNETCPNDIEIGADGKIWVSSTDSWTFGDGGGKVFMSSDNGATFDLKHTVTGNGGGQRVEIETSNTNPNKVYILTELGQADSSNPTIEVKLEVTNDAFATAPTELALPAGNETRETTYGFTGAQAFYDLMIESDPTNDQILYVGGIDLYRSANGGTTTAGWVAISNWTANVHFDQLQNVPQKLKKIKRKKTKKTNQKCRQCMP